MTGTGKTLDKPTAERIVRFLWISFNNATLYGSAHQLTTRALGDCSSTLMGILEGNSPLTLFSEQDSIIFEDFKISEKAYNPRLVVRLRSAGIQSISFFEGLDLAALAEVVRVLADSNLYPEIQTISTWLKRAGIHVVRFNYITYQKVTADEAVVNRADAQQTSNVKLLTKPNASSEPGTQSTQQPSGLPLSGIDLGSFAAVFAKLRMIRDRVKSYDPSRPLPSGKQVIETLSLLRKNVIDELHAQSTSARFEEIRESALGELERLTFDVILRIIKDEYRAGAVSVPRLSQIIRRLIPDLRDMKRLLPLLKKELLLAGMSLEEYLRLAQELIRDFESEGVIESLRDAGEEIGVSVDEIMADLRKDPRTAVRLILLASEFGSTLGGDPTLFREMIDSYVNRICSELTSYPGSTQHQMSILEQELAAHLGSYRKEMEAPNEPPTPQNASLVMDPFSSEQVRIDQPPMSDSVIHVLVNTSEASEPPRSLQLPKGVMRIKETKWNIDRELKRHARYGSPVSTLCISLEGIVTDSGERSATSEEQQAIMDSLCGNLSRTLRGLDLVGTLGPMHGAPSLILLLTMTDTHAAHCVQGRIELQLTTTNFAVNGESIKPRFVLSICGADKANATELTSYLKAVRRAHRKINRT